MKREDITLFSTDITLATDHIYYLTHPSDISLLKYLLSGVFIHNVQENPVFKFHEPLSFFLGGNETLLKVGKAINKMGYKALGVYSCFKNIKPEELTLLIEKMLEDRIVPYVVISNFNAIALGKRSPEAFATQVDWLIDRLQIIQHVFNIPILLTGSSDRICSESDCNDEKGKLIPRFGSYGKAELYTTEVRSVPALSGCKLFQLKKTID